MNNDINEVSDYEQAAINFLNKTNSIITWELIGLSNRLDITSKYLPTIEYKFTLIRGSRSYSANYNNSIVNTCKMLKLTTTKPTLHNIDTCEIINSKIKAMKDKTMPLSVVYLDFVTMKKAVIILPSNYDLLSCLTKYEVDIDFKSFCNEFGYDDFNKYDEYKKIHESCLAEYNALCILYNDDELAELQEIN